MHMLYDTQHVDAVVFNVRPLIPERCYTCYYYMLSLQVIITGYVKPLTRPALLLLFLPATFWV